MKYKSPPTLMCDFYKISHRVQYPKGTEKIYSTWTPRMSRITGVDEVVAFGFQGFIKEYLIDYFNDKFFSRHLNYVVEEYKRAIKYTLGDQDPDTSHIEALHKLGYLPLRIKAVKEGTLVPIRVPMLTVENTLPEFFWLTNYIETLMSCQLWLPTTSATIAHEYHKILDGYAELTGGPKEAVQFQGHDFSMRGMSAFEPCRTSGAGHLLSFVGTDTIPAILYLEDFYGANIENELVGCSVPATEHSVMCAYGKHETELESYRRIVNEVYPSGIVSIVSDTWDLWGVLNNVIRPLKDDILARNGKVVIRPDSGDPVNIVCGNIEIEDFTNSKYVGDLEGCKHAMKEIIVDKVREETPHGEYGQDDVEGFFKYQNKYYRIRIGLEWNRYDKQFYFIDYSKIISCEETEFAPEQKGVIEILWEIFGGIINEKGFKELDPHIGCIYGDAISLDRCKEICRRLASKGFASTNMVFGIGSYTYQFNTRDTFGFALKSTYGVFNGTEQFLFKDPITDTAKFKKSQKGLVSVIEGDNGITYTDNLTKKDRDRMIFVDLLEDIFIDGVLVREETLSEIRKRLNNK